MAAAVAAVGAGICFVSRDDGPSGRAGRDATTEEAAKPAEPVEA